MFSKSTGWSDAFLGFCRITLLISLIQTLNLCLFVGHIIAIHSYNSEQGGPGWFWEKSQREREERPNDAVISLRPAAICRVAVNYQNARRQRATWWEVFTLMISFYVYFSHFRLRVLRHLGRTLFPPWSTFFSSIAKRGGHIVVAHSRLVPMHRLIGAPVMEFLPF